MKSDIILLVISIVLLGAGLALIPIEVNKTCVDLGYSGALVLTANQYDEFKLALLEYAKPGRTFIDYIRVLDQKGELVYLEFSGLPMQEGFPFGAQRIYWHDGPPADWMKPVFIIAGIIVFAVFVARPREEG